MQISISEKNYKVLLKNLAMWNHIYWIMSDMVSNYYKSDLQDYEELIHQFLKYCDDPKIKDNFEWKNIFSEEYENEVMDDLIKYENFVVEDLTGINIEEMDKKIEEELEKNKL